MKFIYVAAIILGILGVALIGAAPAQAANCDQVSSFYGKSFNFPSSWTLGATVNTKLGAPARTWTFERSDDSGGSYTTVQSGLTKSYSATSLTTPTTAATLLRVSAPGCVWVFDPNETAPYQMQPFYGPF